MAGRVADSVWEERRDWIGRQQESGLSAAQFCREHGLHEGNFHSWRLRFAKVNGQLPSGTGKLAGGRQGLKAFVQLPLPPAVAAATGGASWIEISLADGMVVRVPASNLAVLEAVLSSLHGWCKESRHA